MPHQELRPEGLETNYFGRPFLGHYYYTLSLSDLCLGVEKKILIVIMHFRHKKLRLTWSSPSKRTPEPRVMYFGRPFLGHHHYYIFLIYAWE